MQQTVTTQRERQRDSLIVAAAGLLLFTLGIWHQPFIDFETRFALFAQEMWRHGPGWFPTTYGEPYPDYPVTSTLLIWLAAHLFGGVTKLAAVLPTALAATWTLVLTYRLLASYSRVWGILAVCLALLCVTFLAEARSISLDIFVTAIATTAFYVTHMLVAQNHRRWLVAIALCLFAGFAFRGPIGVVIPAAVAASHLALSYRWRQLFALVALVIVVMVACWLGQLLIAKHWYNDAFAQEVIRMQVAGRIDKGEAARYWYYFTSSFGNYALAYPLALIALLLNARLLRLPIDKETDGVFILLVAWTAVILFGLSIPDTKKVRYVLPMVPAIAAIAAYPLAFPQQAYNRRFALFVQWLFALLPAIFAVALLIARHKLKKRGMPIERGDFHWMMGFLAVLQCYAVAIQIKLSTHRRLIGLASGAVATLWLVNLLLVEPMLRKLHDCTAFVGAVEQQRRTNSGDIVFFRIGKDAAAIKYMVNIDADLQPIFVDNTAAIASLKKPFYLIVQDSELAALNGLPVSQMKMIAHEHFDHRLMSAFYVRSQ